MYNPKTPNANNCDPENKATNDAIKVNPLTTLPNKNHCRITKVNINNPNIDKNIPNNVAKWSGAVDKPVTILIVCLTSFNRL